MGMVDPRIDGGIDERVDRLFFILSLIARDLSRSWRVDN